MLPFFSALSPRRGGGAPRDPIPLACASVRCARRLCALGLLRFHLHRPPCIPSFYTAFTPSYFYKFIEILRRDNRVWHSSCKIFCSVISFSVINYVVSMRCPRGSDDSSFFLQKNELGLFESVTFRPQSAVPTAPVRGMRPPLRYGRRLRSSVTLRHSIAAAFAAMTSRDYFL